MSRFRLAPGEPVRIDGQVWFFQRRFGGSTLSLTAEASGEIRNYSDTQLAEAWAHGRLQLLKDYKDGRVAINLRRDFRDVPPSERDEALRRERYVKIALTVWPCDDQALVANIQATSADLEDHSPPRPRTLREWVRRYVLSEHDVRALLPLHRLKGNRRPRFTDEVIDMAVAQIEKNCLRPEPDTVKAAHDGLDQDIYEINLRRTARERLPVPSLSFMHRLAKKVDEERRVREQRGPWIAERKFREVGQGLRETRPLECVEIDFTSWSTILIDEQTMLPIGRPTLAVGYDRCTNLPWGIHLGFEMESYLTVMLLLRNGILPKTYVKELRCGDNPPIHGEWPAWGVPEFIASDNALAMRGTSLEHSCNELKIDLRHLAKRRPDLKPKVERHFGVARVGIADWVPGKADGARETDFSPTERAVITLQEMRFLIHKYLIDVYAVEFDHRLGERRIDCWNRLTKIHQPRFPSMVENLDCLLAASERPRTISSTGIEVFGLKYKDPALIDLRRRHGDIKVAIRYDPGDISRVWAQLPAADGLSQYVPLQAVAQEYARGLTLWQHDKIREFMGAKAKAARTRDYLQAKHELRQTVANLVSSRQSGAGKAYRFLSSPKDPAQSPRATTAEPRPQAPTREPAAAPQVRERPQEPDTNVADFVAQKGWNAVTWRAKR